MDKTKVWTTEIVEDTRRKMESGQATDLSCFFPHDIDFRRANINFKYTQEEQMEIVRCANDILYFADKYAYSMTDEGIQKITLRPYQRRMLKCFQDNRWIILLASRQVGKCLSYNNVINITNGKDIYIGLLYYEMLARQRKLTFIEKIIKLLYKLYVRL